MLLTSIVDNGIIRADEKSGSGSLLSDGGKY